MKTSLIILIVVILVVVVWLLISKTEQHQNMNPISTATQTEPLAKSDKAPDFHLQDYNGKTVSLADFAGKLLVINTWASWCPFCRKELPDFVTAQREFGERVVIVAINRQESLATAKGYTDKQGTSRDLIFLLDPGDSFYQSIGGFSMPETIFVDKNGNIVDHKRGPMDIEEIRERMQKIFAPTSESQGATAAENLVTHSESGFFPSTLRVKIGATVTFKNDEAKSMWVASSPHPIHTDYPGFDAKRGYAKGENYSFIFVKSGTWKYHNHLNPGEGGTIIVE